MKIQAYRIKENWSIDVAYKEKIAKYNKSVKYLLVSVDVSSRFFRVEPTKTKNATYTARAFKRKTTKSFSEKVWSDQGTEFKGEFTQFCDSKNVELYSTHSETKSAFAEQNIGSLKNIIYKHLEKKWSDHYINKLQDFVDIINSRINRVTGLAPKKITTRLESQLVSLVTNQNTKDLQKPKFKPGDFVRVLKIKFTKKNYSKTSMTKSLKLKKIPL